MVTRATKAIGALALTGAVCLTAADAEARIFCADGAEIYAIAKNQHGELPFAEMQGADGARIILFVDPDDKSWTVVAALPDGRLCPNASGSGFDFSGETQQRLDDEFTPGQAS